MNPAQPSVPTRVQTPEMSPLLFGLVPMEQPTVTPQRRVSPMRGAESSLSTQRRSVMTPGSLHTTGGVPPPPIMRLQDDITPEQPTTSAQLTSPAYLTPMTASILPQERAPQYDDTWVTVYGFSQSDVPVILKEFTKCGDVIQVRTAGAMDHPPRQPRQLGGGRHTCCCDVSPLRLVAAAAGAGGWLS